jgi:hypothetical protein
MSLFLSLKESLTVRARKVPKHLSMSDTTSIAITLILLEQVKSLKFEERSLRYKHWKKS